MSSASESVVMLTIRKVLSSERGEEEEEEEEEEEVELGELEEVDALLIEVSTCPALMVRWNGSQCVFFSTSRSVRCGNRGMESVRRGQSSMINLERQGNLADSLTRSSSPILHHPCSIGKLVNRSSFND
ncbi:hypothetical protein PanWU01x14_050840, partial [Parasponia andersonii]